MIIFLNLMTPYFWMESQWKHQQGNNKTTGSIWSAEALRAPSILWKIQQITSEANILMAPTEKEKN